MRGAPGLASRRLREERVHSPEASRAPAWSREPIRWWLGCAAVLAFALVLRVAMVAVCRPAEVSDAGDYRDLAVSMLDRGEYGAIGNSGWNDGLDFRAYRPPGYPLVRAGLMLAFGRGTTPPLALNVVCELVALVCILAAARRTMDRRSALFAGALFATYVLFTASLMTESLSMALWAGLAYALTTRAHVRSLPRAVGVGVAVGFAVLVRPISVVWAPLLAWSFWATRREAGVRWRAGLGAFATAIAVVVGTWTARNYAVFGTFVGLSTNLGVHNAPDFGIPWSRLGALRRTGLDEPSANRALLGEVLRAAREDPAHTAEVLRDRLVDLFSISTENCWELAFARSDVYARSPAATLVLDYAIAAWRLLYVLAAYGALVAARTRHTAQRTVVGALVAFVALQCVLSRGDARLMAPAVPMLCLLAAGALRVVRR